MATARSSRSPFLWAVLVAAGLAGALAGALLAAHGSVRLGGAAHGAASTLVLRPGSHSRLVPQRPPSAWRSATIASGGATLFYPPNWKPVPGDSGTVSFALRGRGGSYEGYLNVTPQQGAERLAGWSSFRLARNRDEGDRHVHAIAEAEGLRFAGSRGSCVIDDYNSRVGSHPYRELACIIAGPHFTNVFIGATLRADWPRLGPVVQRAASSLIER